MKVLTDHVRSFCGLSLVPSSDSVGIAEQQVGERRARDRAGERDLAAREEVVEPVGPVVAELAAGLQVVPADLRRQGVGQVDRARAAQHRQVRVVAERLVAADDEGRVALIDLGQRRPGDAERGVGVGAGVGRQAVAREGVDADAQLVDDAARDGLIEAGREVVPLVEHRRAEGRQVAGSRRERQVAVLAAEGVAHVERLVLPAVVVGLDRELDRVALALWRRHVVGRAARRGVGARIERGRVQAGRAHPRGRDDVAGERLLRERVDDRPAERAEVAGALGVGRHARQPRVGLVGRGWPRR